MDDQSTQNPVMPGADVPGAGMPTQTPPAPEPTPPAGEPTPPAAEPTPASEEPAQPGGWTPPAAGDGTGAAM